MGRGQSSGGGQSSLGYLFGGDDPAPAKTAPKAGPITDNSVTKSVSAPKPAAPPPAPSASVESASNLASDRRNIDSDSYHGAPKVGVNNNNYHRDGGQNNGNFITDRPTTRVHAAPGGGSSLGYLFGGT